MSQSGRVAVQITLGLNPQFKKNGADNCFFWLVDTRYI
jgi:hypothetical protein